MKTRMTSLAVTVALCSGLVSAPVALAQDTCQQGWVVSGGTLDWGIVRSDFRLHRFHTFRGKRHQPRQRQP